jgi:hypothetical protein
VKSLGKHPLRFIVLIASLLGIFGCVADTTQSVTTETQIGTTYDYSDFSALIISDVSQQMSMPEDDYYIYFYGSVCHFCTEIKQTVLSKIQALSQDKVYIVMIDYISDIHNDIDVTGTPAIVHIVNHQVESIHQNKTNVLALLPSLE